MQVIELYKCVKENSTTKSLIVKPIVILIYPFPQQNGQPNEKICNWRTSKFVGWVLMLLLFLINWWNNEMEMGNYYVGFIFFRSE